MTLPTPTAWRIGPDRSIPLDTPVLMGILNVTPDSFSDGGRFDTADDAVAAALAMLDDGAAIIDVGGESTRPGSTRVSADEQIARIRPVIAGIIAARPDAVVSIDTTRGPVAASALDAGARIINDVAAGTEDDALLDLAAARAAGLVLMHRLRPPDADAYCDQYADTPPDYAGDVVGRVGAFLHARIAAARAAGVRDESIVLDPGLGFGKTVHQNVQLIRDMSRSTGGRHAVLSAASRKSFIGVLTGVETPEARVAGSVAVSVLHWLQGVRLFRVHDVAAHREALGVASAVHRATPPTDPI